MTVHVLITMTFSFNKYNSRCTWDRGSFRGSALSGDFKLSCKSKLILMLYWSEPQFGGMVAVSVYICIHLKPANLCISWACVATCPWLYFDYGSSRIIKLFKIHREKLKTRNHSLSQLSYSSFFKKMWVP